MEGELSFCRKVTNQILIESPEFVAYRDPHYSTYWWRLVQVIVKLNYPYQVRQPCSKRPDWRRHPRS